ncbi:hypothetical protein VM98_34825, partial [Streptomyces rubellomurinus subsp. indigoferus]
LPRDRAEELLARWDGRLSVADVNGPASTVVAGDGDALDELLAHFQQSEIRARPLDVHYSLHSPPVDEPAEEAEAPEAGDRPVVPRVLSARDEQALHAHARPLPGQRRDSPDPDTRLAPRTT